MYVLPRVTSEAVRQWLSRVTKSRVGIIAESPHEWQIISVFTATHSSFYFLHVSYCLDGQTNSLKQSSNAQTRHFRQGRFFFWIVIVMPQCNLWRHANAMYWHRGVIFVDRSCTQKLTQRRSSIVNNNREYRFPAIRFPRRSILARNICITDVHSIATTTMTIVANWW